MRAFDLAHRKAILGGFQVIKTFAAATLALAVTTPAAFAATTFDFESTAAGFNQGSLSVVDGATTLKVTPVGSADYYVLVSNSSLPALLGTRGVIGVKTRPVALGQFTGLRFAFSHPVNSVTFNFGDTGGDDDSPVTFSAFSAANVLLGTVTAAYPAGLATGLTQTLNFTNASYFLVSSGSTIGNENSIFYDISSYKLSSAPEPATWAMMVLGMGLAGWGLRRVRRAQPRLA